MKTILVPVDFSEVTPVLVDVAKQLAVMSGSRVVLLHTIVYAEGTVAPGLIPVVIEAQADPLYARRLLDEIKSRFDDTGVEVRSVIIKGGMTVDNILAECEARDAGMIVMGSHGHGSLYNLLVGSVAAGVIKSAKCPVLIVPSPVKHLAAA